MEDGAEADKAEEQKSATEHSDAAAEDTDDAGNALAEEEDSAVAKDTPQKKMVKKVQTARQALRYLQQDRMRLMWQRQFQ